MTTITVLIPLVAAIIPHNGSELLTASASRYFVSTGGNDFEWRIFASIGGVFLLMCVANFLFLRRHAITRRQLESDRRYRLLRDGRVLSVVRQPAWVRVAGHLFFTTGVPLVLYVLVSNNHTLGMFAGILGAAAFLGYHVWLALREILHSRSTHNRRYLFYRCDPTFIKIRLLFGLVRRYAYFVFGFAVLAYGIHRLNPEIFTVQNNGSALFVLHVESSINGLTKFGTEELAAKGNAGVIFFVGRSTFGVLALLWLSNLLLAGLIGSGEPSKTKQAAPKSPAAEAVAISVLTPHQETETNVVATISECLQIPEKDVTLQSDLTSLGADSLDVINIHVVLEQCFGKEVEWKVFASMRTVADIVALFLETSAAEQQTVSAKNSRD